MSKNAVRDLAVRLPNWVGDTLMAVPTLTQLERSGFRLQVLGRGWAKDLLAALPLEVSTTSRGIRNERRALAGLKARRMVLLPNSLSTAVAARWAGMQTIGYDLGGRRLLLSHRVAKPHYLHELEYFWRLGAYACEAWSDGGPAWPATPPLDWCLPLTDVHRALAKRALTAAEVQSPYVVCCPLAVGTTGGMSRLWPHFAELCRALLSTGYQVLACPGPGEEEACVQRLPGATLLPKLSLGAYGAVMQGAHAVVANNSGPMHLAAAVGVPVLGIFSCGDVARTRPWGGSYVGGSGAWPSLAEVCAAFTALPANERRLAA